MGSKGKQNRAKVTVKRYKCFVCNCKLQERSLPLLVAETALSRICLGEKLQEILGDRFYIIVTSRDQVCWRCACCINQIDKFQEKIEILKERLISAISAKYEIKIPAEVLKPVPETEEAIETFEDKTGIEVITLEETSRSELKTEKNGREIEISEEDRGKEIKTPEEKTEREVKILEEKIGRDIITAKEEVIVIDKEPKHTESIKFILSQQAPTVKTQVESSVNGLTNHSKVNFGDNTKKETKNHAAKESTSDTVHFLSTPTSRKLPNGNILIEPLIKKTIQCYPCRFCENRYGNEAALLSHMLQRHPPKFLCHICDSSFSNETRYKDHLVLHTFKHEKFTCHKCGFKSRSFIDEEHVCNYKCFVCVSCGKQKYLESGDNEDDMYKCEECLCTELMGASDGEQLTMIPQQCLIDPMALQSSYQVISMNGNCCELNGKESLLEQSANAETAYLRCSNCAQEFELASLASHRCFVENQVLQDAQALEDGKDDFVELKCKTCFVVFNNTDELREHWQTSGHSWELETHKFKSNKIVDRYSNKEKTFNVVRQEFRIRANIPIPEGKQQTQQDNLVQVKEMFVNLTERFNCSLCSLDFPTEEDLSQHQQSGDCLTCITCSVRFLNAKLLKKHYGYTGHSRKVVPGSEDKEEADKDAVELSQRKVKVCPMCGKECPTRFQLCKHLSSHYRGRQQSACHYCFEEVDKRELQAHVLLAHNARLYKCEHCDRTFLSHKFCLLHQAKHRREEFSCGPCRLKFPSKRMLVQHKETVHRREGEEWTRNGPPAEGDGACRICGKLIQDRCALRRHEKRHYYNKGLQCSLCLRIFRNKKALEVHSTMHGGQFKVECGTCKRGFMSATALEEHAIVHNKKKYTCARCGVKCGSRNSYWLHLKMHNAPYKCTVCPRAFRDTSLLAVHRRRHWRVRPYRCPHCSRSFSVPSTLSRHLTKHTRAFPHKCALCKKGFLTRYAFLRHLENLHNIQQWQEQGQATGGGVPQSPSLPLAPTDDDLFQAADNLIADESVMLLDYSRQHTNELITNNEVVVETTRLFDQLLH